LLVLGPEAGWRAADERGLAALFVARGADGRLDERINPAFAALAAGGAGAGERRATGAWLTWLLAAGVFGLAAAGLGIGAIAGRGPLRRSCSPEACGGCRRPCRRRPSAPASWESAR